MDKKEEYGVKNTRQREQHIERAVIDCLNKVEKAIAGVNPTDNDMKWSIIDNFANPTKEEINMQLNRIPAIQSYYNNMKVYAQLLSDIAEHELFIAQVNAREEYKEVHQLRLQNYEAEISKRMGDALRSTAQDKAMMLVKEMVRAMKPKDPTDKDIESFIKKKTQVKEREVIIHKSRYNKLKEFCKILDNKFAAAKSISFSISESNKADVNVSKNSI